MKDNIRDNTSLFQTKSIKFSILYLGTVLLTQKNKKTKIKKNNECCWNRTNYKKN
jgi:hypothetical protein